MIQKQGIRPSLLRFTVGMSLLGAAALAPRSAMAQDRWYAQVEGGVSMMLTAPQSNLFGLGGYGSARLGVRLIGPLGLHLSVAYDNWGGKAGAIDPNTGMQVLNGSFLDLGGGLRFAPELSRTLGTIFIDAGLGFATTGSASDHQVALDVGLGWLIPLGRWVGIGPVVRYNDVVATSNQIHDARFFTAGLAIGFPGHSAPPEAPADTDQDGVPDAQDLCPTVPMGSHPDPARPGCPLGDRDQDGVTDDVDQCPDVPAGAHPDPRRPGCPMGDRDHDGFTDDIDQCPDTPSGSHPDPSRPGCPIADRDGDGVLDAVDLCPDQPAGDHPDPARRGCPMAAAVVTSTSITINQQVFFEVNRSTIQPRSFPILNAVVTAMVTHPEIRRMRVEGNADDTGGAARNMALSQTRAHAVMSFLKHHGIARTRLEFVGYGSTRPAVQGDTPDAHAANRRVEFIIVDGPGASHEAAAAFAAPVGPGPVAPIRGHHPHGPRHGAHPGRR